MCARSPYEKGFFAMAIAPVMAAITDARAFSMNKTSNKLKPLIAFHACRKHYKMAGIGNERERNRSRGEKSTYVCAMFELWKWDLFSNC